MHCMSFNQTITARCLRNKWGSGKRFWVIHVAKRKGIENLYELEPSELTLAEECIFLLLISLDSYSVKVSNCEQKLSSCGWEWGGKTNRWGSSSRNSRIGFVGYGLKKVVIDSL